MSVELPINRFKLGLATGRKQIGLWSSLSNPHTAEVLAGAGYDWLLFDTEHAPLDVGGLIDVLRAASAAAHCAVRIPWNDPVLVKRALDIGAQTLFVPFVQSAEEAKKAVQACRYPPHGIRGVAGATRASGFGRIANYHAQAASEICVIVQVETREAVGALEEIASVPGVDGVFIGPSDLSASYGYLGQPAAEAMQEVLADCAKRLSAVGARSGILAGTQDQALTYFDYGYDFVAAGVDALLLARAADALRTAVATNIQHTETAS